MQDKVSITGFEFKIFQFGVRLLGFGYRVSGSIPLDAVSRHSKGVPLEHFTCSKQSNKTSHIFSKENSIKMSFSE